MGLVEEDLSSSRVDTAPRMSKMGEGRHGILWKRAAARYGEMCGLVAVFTSLSKDVFR
jgi:hypothetical protein